MKSIILKSLSLTNFKGIKSLRIDFSEVTDIHGANGSGKTTIFDAFTWLLFGKDSQDKKDFDIKPLDDSGNIIQKIENEVEGTLFCNGDTITLKRIHREKWVKKRGSSEPEFTGNETVYFWNDVPMNAKDYTAKINELLDESVFKLISNPLAFNNLKWQDRRNVLMNIAGDIKVDYALHGLDHILQLTEKKSIAELKAEVNAKVKKIKEELKQIPTRIDEVQKSKPVPLLFDQLSKELAAHEVRLQELDSLLLDSSKQNQALLNRKTEIQNQIFEKQNQINSIEWELKNQANNQTKVDTSKIDSLKQQLSNQRFELSNAKSNLQQIENKIVSDKNQLDSLDFDMARLREDWKSINSEKLSFDETAFHCPACKREFESGDVDSKKAELTANFNKSKSNRLETINQKGGSLKAEHEQISKQLTESASRIESQKAYVAKLESEINAIASAIQLEQNVLASTETKSADSVLTELVLAHPQHGTLKTEIENLTSELNSIQPIKNEELEQEKQSVQQLVKEINAKLGVKLQIAAADNRIKELEQEESKLSNSLLELEKQEFDIEKFIKLGIEALENSINDKFSLVKFRLFETQINGGEIECCDALINGVPFDSANTASRINAGIDIINTLCEYYQVNAPIIIDNRESVSKLIDSNSQIINLIVSESDAQLRVSSKVEKLQTA